MQDAARHREAPDRVLEKVNEITLEKINMTLDLEMYNIDVPQIHSLADVDAVFAQVAEQEPEMWMVSFENTGMPDMEMLDYICGLQDFVIPDPTESTEVTTLFQADSFKTWCDYNFRTIKTGSF